MKKNLMHNILDMVSTLYQAHEEIQKNIEEKQYTMVQSLINQCQEFAVVIGTTIEETEGKDFITVLHIEEYCEALYRIHEALYADNKVNASKVSKTLKQYLLTVEYSLQHDIIVKKEIVFLPYKVSMWDSLESVWKAADEDPECDAYVIPIPYYDKNPDGTLRDEHYEGNKFPSYVPITHYNNYDFKNRHPDAIFIHNPYDQCNYVTTVHPFFYTNKLKEYTDKLIYIPYYISAEEDPYNPDVMKDRAGYVLSNGVLNSDIVIVQSENTKKLFVNILEKNIPGINHSYWENKILGLGSPKLDRVNNIQRDDSKLPDTWKKIIYTTSGKRKITIFYNISVSPLLNNPNMLEKIKDTLDFFRNSNDVCLWWRPHPLYESTLASMRPELLEEYKKIVSKYKKERWGIFDDGVDLEWAIAETDAYYGDRSSVVNLYKETEKPVMIQSPYVKSKLELKMEDVPIWPSTFFVDSEYIWFVHGKMNLLMRYDLKMKRTAIIAKIPGETFFLESSYQAIYKYKNKIFLIPCWAREIAVYDILDNKFQKISLKNREKYEQKLLFCKVYLYNNFLYAIPYQYNAIVKINIDSLDINYIDVIKQIKNIKPNISIFFIADAVQLDEEIAMTILNTNKILFFNLNTCSIKLCSGQEGREFTFLTCINSQIYIYDKKAEKIIKWNRTFYNEEEEFFAIKNDEIELKCLESKYILIDNPYNTVTTVIDERGIVLYQNSDKCHIEKRALNSSYCCGICSNQIDNKYYFDFYDNGLYQFEDGKPQHKVIHFKIKDKMRYLFQYDIESISNENELLTLKKWLSFIKKPENISVKYQNRYGKQIFVTVKSIL